MNTLTIIITSILVLGIIYEVLDMFGLSEDLAELIKKAKQVKAKKEEKPIIKKKENPAPIEESLIEAESKTKDTPSITFDGLTDTYHYLDISLPKMKYVGWIGLSRLSIKKSPVTDTLYYMEYFTSGGCDNPGSERLKCMNEEDSQKLGKTIAEGLAQKYTPVMVSNDYWCDTYDFEGTGDYEGVKIRFKVSWSKQYPALYLEYFINEEIFSQEKDSSILDLDIEPGMF